MVHKSIWRRRCLRSASSSLTWTVLGIVERGVRGNRVGVPPDDGGASLRDTELAKGSGVRVFDGVEMGWDFSALISSCCPYLSFMVPKSGIRERE